MSSSLLNYSTPFFGTPNPATVFHHHHQPPAVPIPPPHAPPYHYPRPDRPFLGEEYPQPPPPPSPPAIDRETTPTLSYGYPQNGGVGGGDDVRRTENDYDYEEEETASQPPVTPIQGPIFLKNGSVPVVPLYSYPVVNNGTLVQIPILWTALSVALGLELRGEYIRGVPCLVRNFQLFCPKAGTAYPLDRIQLFIDENKALMKRMYGQFDLTSPYPPEGGGRGRKRSTLPTDDPRLIDPGPNPFMEKIRTPRQAFRNNQSSESGRVDVCQSQLEIITPYWASNSAGKIRAIVNTQHFEQAIHQETCSKTRTNRCAGDCGCEQKYKWHRLLAYDPDNDCKGIFMDWFLFPSCCVCRCKPNGRV